MLRRCRVALWGEAPSVYPYHKPFRRTPYDEDRIRLRRRDMRPSNTNAYPRWMDTGIDGTGNGVGLHRAHPLSPLVGNIHATEDNVPHIYRATMQGFWHRNGSTLYYRGGKVPRPEQQPYLTGEPCPVYGWKITDHNVTRKFEAPIVDKDKVRYKPYVAQQEARFRASAGTESTAAAALVTDGSSSNTSSGGGATSPPTAPPPSKPPTTAGDKPLLKRLFFWK